MVIEKRKFLEDHHNAFRREHYTINLRGKVYEEKEMLDVYLLLGL